MNKADLRSLIVESLKTQGFVVQGGRIRPPADLDKETLRRLHAPAAQHKIEERRAQLSRFEPVLQGRLARGSEVVPEAFFPRLVEVEGGTEDELLFRYAALHWSIPVSSGYGRRVRFLVLDEHNQKLVGILGLGDPVFNLGARDAWIGWTKKDKTARLRHVMDAFVLGAVPPYSFLLCGKLLGMLASSEDVRCVFHAKYGYRRSLILRRRRECDLALITTTSALGRSSVYNRIKYHGRLLLESVGFTAGSGDFHFSNGLYAPISRYAQRYCTPTAKNSRWGAGFRNRRETIKKCLQKVGISSEWAYHGIQRELFVLPLAHNSREFLRGEEGHLKPFLCTASEFAEFFKARWMIPRSRRDEGYRDWDPRSWSLWS